ncbi:hypothetical protein KM1_314880 [Entamoeba histolytica HM-3:IMSS]|uniref:Uncharacterized protein n=4 Tax=Entamoeba histolytica TaxID=5759 RepID=C4LY70_ENTH1|nr:hypothetical protein EHI_051740 [Entamoeba histolytica HM-1:IMSS]EAL45915.1 hypothetical protein EHI_051740 [Entamoeba histolytica HM-1:IMSS]EMD45369.1 Hypothetical protein EHI5A_230330 [Entamoeba histolytica KU27]EMS10873.1 hypothetical protein KM1_314880 [Entamoeba histolytica HM-3:IMSS]GAT93741.1 hypothetical protein CL6EHI_051740 [Entamoeba histolytica]|eukprot:XP_651301.1 hypothetical protein EHI_051740 [Entamoeba histolytica HM-1:IMSS]
MSIPPVKGTNYLTTNIIPILQRYKIRTDPTTLQIKGINSNFEKGTKYLFVQVSDGTTFCSCYLDCSNYQERKNVNLSIHDLIEVGSVSSEKVSGKELLTLHDFKKKGHCNLLGNPVPFDPLKHKPDTGMTKKQKEVPNTTKKSTYTPQKQINSPIEKTIPKTTTTNHPYSPTFQTPFSGIPQGDVSTISNSASNNHLTRDYRIKGNTPPTEGSFQEVIDQLRDQLKMKEEEIAYTKNKIMWYNDMLNIQDQRYKELENNLEYERKRTKSANENESQSKKELAKMSSVLKRYQEENTQLRNLLQDNDRKIQHIESYNSQLKEEIQTKEEKIKQLEETLNDRKMIIEGTFDLN